MRIVWIGVAVVCSVALTACGKDSTGPGTTTGISGNWQFQESLANTSAGLSCADSAQITVSQNGLTFTANYAQTGTCSVNGQLFDNSGTGTISDGRISGDSISFSEDICAYRGVLSGTPSNRMAGTVDCTDTSTAQPLTISGAWTATR